MPVTRPDAPNNHVCKSHDEHAQHLRACLQDKMQQNDMHNCAVPEPAHTMHGLACLLLHTNSSHHQTAIVSLCMQGTISDPIWLYCLPRDWVFSMTARPQTLPRAPGQSYMQQDSLSMHIIIKCSHRLTHGLAVAAVLIEPCMPCPMKPASCRTCRTRLADAHTRTNMCDAACATHNAATISQAVDIQPSRYACTHAQVCRLVPQCMHSQQTPAHIPFPKDCTTCSEHASHDVLE